MILTEDSIQETLVLDASLPKVWEALTSPDQMKIWYDPALGIEGKVEVGEEVVFVWQSGRSRIKIVEKHPMERFAYRWVPAECVDAPIVDEGTSLVTFHLSAEGDKTKLTLVESGLSKLAPGTRGKAFYMNSWGWDECFVGLRKLVEKEEELADSMHFQGSINAPLDRVWQLLSSTDGFLTAMGFPQFEGEIVAGKDCFFTMDNERMRMHFVSVTPKRELAFRWTPGECCDDPITEEKSTLVTIQLISYEEKTLLLLREEGFKKFLEQGGKRRFQMNEEGWGVEVLPMFKKFAEGL